MVGFWWFLIKIQKKSPSGLFWLHLHIITGKNSQFEIKPLKIHMRTNLNFLLIF